MRAQRASLFRSSGSAHGIPQARMSVDRAAVAAVIMRWSGIDHVDRLGRGTYDTECEKRGHALGQPRMRAHQLRATNPKALVRLGLPSELLRATWVCSQPPAASTSSPSMAPAGSQKAPTRSQVYSQARE